MNIIPKNDSNKDIETEIGNIKIKISIRKNEGLYEMDNFKINQFSKEEVLVIYSNLGNKKEEDFKYSIIESKLSQNKIEDLIEKFKNDSHLFKMKGITNRILLGFFNSDKIQIDNHINLLKDINYVIYGIKYSKLNGKRVKYVIDWELVKEVKVLRKKIDEIISYVKPKKDDKKEKDNETELKKENIGNGNKKKEINDGKEIIRKDEE